MGPSAMAGTHSRVFSKVSLAGYEEAGTITLRNYLNPKDMAVRSLPML